MAFGSTELGRARAVNMAFHDNVGDGGGTEIAQNLNLHNLASKPCEKY